MRTAEVRPGPVHTPAPAPRRPAEAGVVELDGATAWIPGGWSGEWRDGSLVVTRT